jgi:hypothetical protein
MNGLEPLIPIALFFSIAGVAIMRGPLGRGLADRLSGRAAERELSGPDDRTLRAEVEELRFRLHDVEERLDFAERMLTRGRAPGPVDSE